ncbi:MAG: acetylornithine/succinylornithine family transaminase [Akkermansiaceae bacterium]|jgi:predicted acetylornithine/succinylornithine family transaminase|nr:acetylornithine/succinylornithine family transaminase [Akkermansiaceae bacterium]
MTTTEKTKQYVLETYGRFPLTVARGKGTRVWDERGREYLDFCSGIATCSLGHCHPALTKAIAEQSTTLMHCSNLYYIGQQADLAELIVERVVGHPGKIFFSNSGAEANDGLIKFARRFGQATGRYEVITFNKSFHGRTIGAMTATAQAKIHEGFDPLPTGFTYVEPNNLDAVKAALTDKTAAFLLEPIQGEGGVNPMTREFLEGLSGLAKEKDILLLLDEVQCGFGRTGDLNGYDTIASGLAPDGISWAKGMGGGFPIGSFYVAEKHAHLLGPGSHGSTYGGNALACAASKAVIETIIAENLTENVKAREAQIRETIAGWNHPAITEVRGHGLLLGIGLKPDTLDIPEGKAASIHLCAALIEKGLLVPPAGPEIVRLLPPLNVSADEVDQALQLVKAAFDDHLKS